VLVLVDRPDCPFCAASARSTICTTVTPDGLGIVGYHHKQEAPLDPLEVGATRVASASDFRSPSTPTGEPAPLVARRRRARVDQLSFLIFARAWCASFIPAASTHRESLTRALESDLGASRRGVSMR
jgi:hypothetical protein